MQQQERFTAKKNSVAEEIRQGMAETHSMVATARELRLRMSLILSLIDGLKLHC